MSLRSAVRGIVLVAAGAAVASAASVLLSPAVRRTALGLVGRGGEAEPQQPTHIVLPDRAAAPHADHADGDDAEDGSLAASDVALAGA